MAFPRRCDINDSSNIQKVWYDPDDRKMIITFNNGSSYEYGNVSPTDFGAIVGSDSVGQSFNILLKSRNWNTIKL